MECCYCHSTFVSFDEVEDAGEAADRIDQWARQRLPFPREPLDVPPADVENESAAEGESSLQTLRPR